MSEIKPVAFERLFVLEHDHCEGSGDGHPCGGCASCCDYPYQVCDKNGKTAIEFHSAVTEEQAQAVVAALNAQPDAGDVEALANDMWRTYHNDFHGEIVKQGTMGVMRLLAGGVVRRYAACEAALRAENERLRQTLVSALRNDRSKEYEHHEKRPWDGKKPSEASTGTKWLTPREIAKNALKERESGE